MWAADLCECCHEAKWKAPRIDHARHTFYQKALSLGSLPYGDCFDCSPVRWSSNSKVQAMLTYFRTVFGFTCVRRRSFILLVCIYQEGFATHNKCRSIQHEQWYCHLHLWQAFFLHP